MAGTLARLRRQAFAAQDGRCFYCCLPMWERNGRAFARRYGLTKRMTRCLRCTAEHLLARQDQGKDVKENIVAACSWCNQQRHRSSANAPDPRTWQEQVRTMHASRHPAGAIQFFRS